MKKQKIIGASDEAQHIPGAQKLTPETLARVLRYGQGWLVGSEEIEAYKIGVMEGVAHLGACIICQDMVDCEPVPTGDIRDMMLNAKTEEKLARQIRRYVADVNLFQEPATTTLTKVKHGSKSKNSRRSA